MPPLRPSNPYAKSFYGYRGCVKGEDHNTFTHWSPRKTVPGGSHCPEITPNLRSPCGVAVIGRAVRLG